MNIESIEDVGQKAVELEGAQGVRMRMLIGPDKGASHFHMRQFQVAQGGHTPHHAHDYEHEVLILSGSGIVKSDQGDHPFKPRDVIYMPPNEKHQFFNTGETVCEFICLIPAPKDCTGG